eukprot:1334453-Heterocapsa_arctica.AAC.1
MATSLVEVNPRAVMYSLAFCRSCATRSPNTMVAMLIECAKSKNSASPAAQTGLLKMCQCSWRESKRKDQTGNSSIESHPDRESSNEPE